jgi:hypothetical protein
MTAHRSVNEVLAQLATLDGQPLEIEGILELQPEGFSLLHYPKAERKVGPQEGEHQYEASVWVGFGGGSLQPNREALNRWVGKRVRIHGILSVYLSLQPFGTFGRGGFGPWGFWPAQIEPYSVQRITSEERRENAV